MEANELRIGNIVNHKDTGSMNIKCGKDISEIEDWLSYTDYYTGVLISEEWLLKFGFKYDKVDTKEFYTLHYFDCKFLYTEGRIKLGIQGVAQYHWLPIIIDYVHELQNAYFTLTGEELPYS